MTTIVGSALSTPHVPLQPGSDPDVAASDATAAPPQTTAPSAPVLTAGNGVSDSLLGSLVAQQNVSANSAIDQDERAGGLDLKGQDLRKTDLKTLDLRGADLSGSNLSGVDLSGLDLSGANLTGASLSGATIKNANLENISAQGADFSGATLLDTSLDGADLSNANFGKASIGKSSIAPVIDESNWDATYESDIKLDGASFKGATLQAIFFERASAANADFSNITADRTGFLKGDLRGANFDGVSGGGVAFTQSNLSGASFTNSTARSAGFYSSTLEGTRFAGSSFNRTSFVSTNLSVADLTGVVREARSASFGDTNLAGVDFSDFDFSGARFSGDKNYWTDPAHVAVAGSGASLKDTNFSGANFTGAMLSGFDFGATASLEGAVFSRTIVQYSDISTVGETSGIEYDASAVSSAAILRSGPSNSQSTRLSAEEASVQAQAPASERNQAAALALETLQSVNEQLRAAKDRDYRPDGILALFRNASFTSTDVEKPKTVAVA